jgi:hypothetical protein
MIFPPEYSWLESYLDNDSLWLEESLNWEEAFDLALSDFFIFSIFTTPTFYNNHFFVDSLIKFSFLDVMLINQSAKIFNSKELYDLFIWDLISVIYNKFLPFQFIFYTDYQDYLTTLLYYSPELVLVLTDYINLYWSNNVLNYSPAVVFDLFSDILNTAASEFLEHFILFFLFIWLVVFFINLFTIVKWNNPLEIYFVRFYYYIYSASK